MNHETTEAQTAREQYWDTLARNPNLEWSPADLQRDAPDGFQIVLDPYRETIRVFGPFSEQGVPMKTLVLWGGAFKVRGEDALRAYVEACQRGESRDVHERVRHLRGRLHDLPSFAIPEKAPLDRPALDAHLDACMICRPHVEAMARKIDGGRSLPTTVELRALMAHAHATPEKTPARAKRTNTTTMTATEV